MNITKNGMQILWVAISLCYSIALFPNSNLFYITLGKGMYCKGYNICQIQKSGNYSQSDQAQVSISVKDSKIEFSFLKTSINAQQFLNYFSTGYFILDEDYTLPSFVSEILILKRTILKAGSYKVQVTSSSYIVDF